MIYIPNLLTLARIGLVPWLVVLLESHHYGWALCVFLVAGITDALDGYLAKKYNAQTYLGSILDPLADKALLVTSYVMLSIMEIVPFWLTVVVVFRDIVIVGGNILMVMFFSTMDMRPLLISKLNTVMQIFYVFLVLFSLSFNIQLSGTVVFFGILVAVTSVLSGLAYVYIGSIKATRLSEGDLNS